jgi:hypothetical protein
MLVGRLKRRIRHGKGTTPYRKRRDLKAGVSRSSQWHGSCIFARSSLQPAQFPSPAQR